MEDVIEDVEKVRAENWTLCRSFAIHSDSAVPCFIDCCLSERFLWVWVHFETIRRLLISEVKDHAVNIKKFIFKSIKMDVMYLFLSRDCFQSSRIFSNFVLHPYPCRNTDVMEITWACFVWNTVFYNDLLINSVISLGITGFASFNNLIDIPSLPAVFLMFILSNCLLI